MQAEFRTDMMGSVELHVTSETGDQTLLARMLVSACERTAPLVSAGEDGVIVIGDRVMAFTEDDMRQTIDLANELSAENRRLKRSVSYQRELLRVAIRRGLDLGDVAEDLRKAEGFDQETKLIAEHRDAFARLVAMSKMARTKEVWRLLSRCAGNRW